MNKKNKNAKLSVDSSWAVSTGTNTIMIDQSSTPKRVYGLDDDDVTTNPKVVEEDLKVGDAGQTWTVTRVEKTDGCCNVLLVDPSCCLYTFSINNYFLTGRKNGIKVQGT